MAREEGEYLKSSAGNWRGMLERGRTVQNKGQTKRRKQEHFEKVTLEMADLGFFSKTRQRRPGSLKVKNNSTILL